jgi:hypothetical protein
MSKPKIKDLVQGEVTFMFYQKGELWYKTANGFEFPVPIEDTGDAQFNPTDKGMLFMRWIRKHVDMLEQARKDQEFDVTYNNDMQLYVDSIIAASTGN